MAVVRFFTDSAMPIEVQWEEGEDICVTLSKALVSTHHIMLGEREVEEEQLSAHNKITGWAPVLEVSRYMIDTKGITISLLARKAKDLRDVLKEWLGGRKLATVKAFRLAGKLHHATLVIRPARYFERRLLQLNSLNLDEAEYAGGGDAWGRYRMKAKTRRVLVISSEFMADADEDVAFRRVNERKRRAMCGDLGVLDI